MREHAKIKDMVQYAQLEVRFPEGEPLVLGADILRSFEASDASSQTGGISVGFAAMRELKAELEDNFSSYDWENASVEAFVTDGEESIRYGLYCVATVKVSDGVTNLQMYDTMYRHEQDYESRLGFPASVEDVIAELAAAHGYQVPGLTQMGFAGIMIAEKPEGVTERQLLAYMMQLAGGYVARFNALGQLTFAIYDKAAWQGAPKEVSGLISEDYEASVTVTGIRCIVDGVEYATGAKGYVIEITGNPLVNQANAAETIQRIAEHYIGLTMCPCSFSIHDAYELECVDAVRVVDRSGAAHDTYIMSLTTSLQNETSCVCTALPKAKQAASGGSAGQRILQAAEQKAEQKLSQYDTTVKSLTDTISHGLGLFVTRERQPDGSVITYLHDSADMEQSLVRFYATANGLIGQTRASVTASWETTAALSSMGQALLQVLTVQGLNAGWINSGTFAAKDKDGNIVFSVNVDTGDILMDASSITMKSGKTVQQGIEEVQESVDNLQIGGRNLARGTSVNYSAPFTNFNGGTNKTVNLGKVYTTGLSVGDVITVHLYYQYEDIVAATGQEAKVYIQGNGDVTGWAYGAFAGSPYIHPTGSGEYEFLYSIAITEDRLKNNYWNVNIRHDYVQSGSVRYKMFKVEKGNKATDWTPAPEDTEETISGLKETVTTQGTEISAIQGQISSKIWQQDITTAVDNLQVGGRNLLLNSNVLYTRTNDAQTVSSKNFFVSVEALKSLIGKTVTESFYLYSPGRRDTSLSENANMSYRFGCHLSFVWRKSSDPSGAAKVTYPGLLLSISKEERGRVSATVTVSPPEGYDVLYSAALGLQQYAKPADANIEWEIGYPKLEIGDKATDWTPAPEDTEGELDALNTKCSEINQTVDGISATVGSHSSELDGLETRVTDAEAGIRLSAEEIATKVSKDGVISAINQTAEEVAIDAGKINLNGAVTANEYFRINEDGSMETKAGNIGSWEISTTGIHKSYKAYVPPDEDSLKQLKEIILDGTLTKNKMYLAWYDYDNDGVLTTTDLLYCKRLVVGAVTIDYYEQTYGFIRPTFDVTVSIRTIKIDTSESDASFSIWTYAYLKEKTYRFGIDGLTAANGKFGGVNTELLAASEVSCDTLTVNGTQETFSLANSTKVYNFSDADYPAGTVAELIVTGPGGVAYALLLFSATMQLAVNNSTWTAAGAIKLAQTNNRQITFSYTGTAAATFTSRIVKK